MEDIADKTEITELVNKLFMYTDERNWAMLMEEVFTERVDFDMTGSGTSAKTAEEICETWEAGLKDIDQLHHQAGHYLIHFESAEADIYAYAIAWHYRKAAANGHTRTFIGSYDLHAIETPQGWRLNKFVYHLKFMDGNETLQ